MALSHPWLQRTSSSPKAKAKGSPKAKAKVSAKAKAKGSHKSKAAVKKGMLKKPAAKKLPGKADQATEEEPEEKKTVKPAKTEKNN